MGRPLQRSETDSGAPRGAASGRRPPAGLAALQRHAGNAAVARILARDGLEPPTLLGGRRERHAGLLGQHLHLDPVLQTMLAPDAVLEHLAEVVPVAPVDAALAAPDPRPRRGDPPPPDPAALPGYEQPARSGSAGALLEAVRTTPQVRDALEDLQQQVYGRLSSGQKAAVVSTSITLGAGVLGGLLATPRGRALLGRLSGVQLPVPKAPWLAFEFTTEKDAVGVGVHVDVGALLPARLGFGRATAAESAPSLYADPGQHR